MDAKTRWGALALLIVSALSCGIPTIGTGLPNGAPADLSCLPADSGGTLDAVLRGTTSSPYGYKLYLPGGYGDCPYPYPVIIFLHGSGAGEDPEAGPESVRRLGGGPLSMASGGRWNPRYPMIIAAPQYTDEDGRWVPERLKLFIKHLKGAYNVNAGRIYLTGLSMGGYGTFSYLGSREGDDIAAAVPICGGGHGGQAALIARTPVWAFHGEQDGTVPYGNSVSMVDAVNATSPMVRAKVTLFPGLGHGCWTQTYEGPGLAETNPDHAPFVMNIYDWMFQFSK